MLLLLLPLFLVQLTCLQLLLAMHHSSSAFSSVC
jgi:hypothetical protein